MSTFFLFCQEKFSPKLIKLIYDEKTNNNSAGTNHYLVVFENQKSIINVELPYDDIVNIYYSKVRNSLFIGYKLEDAFYLSEMSEDASLEEIKLPNSSSNITSKEPIQYLRNGLWYIPTEREIIYDSDSRMVVFSLQNMVMQKLKSINFYNNIDEYHGDMSKIILKIGLFGGDYDISVLLSTESNQFDKRIFPFFFDESDYTNNLLSDTKELLNNDSFWHEISSPEIMSQLESKRNLLMDKRNKKIIKRGKKLRKSLSFWNKD